MATKWAFRIFFGFIICTFVSCSASTLTISASENEESEAIFDSSVFSDHVQRLESGMSSTVAAIDGNPDQLLVALYSYNSTNSSAAFQLGESRALDLMIPSENADGELDAEASFQNLLRSTERSLDAEKRMSSPARGKALSAERSVGDVETFKVLNSTSSVDDYEVVTATLRYAGDGFDLYVDNRNEDNLSDGDLAEIGYGFNVQTEHEIFGTESDVDGDGRFAVLFTQAVNELGASSGGIVTGYFFAVDLYDSSFYEISNEREVFYTITPDPEGEVGAALSRSFALSNLYPTVLPHEFQHMINFNERVLVNEVYTESAWLNEGLSHLAEDITNTDANGFMAEPGIENYSRVASYLGNVQNICITCGTSLSQRGGMYLFMRYLYEQAEIGNINGLDDGAALIERLVQGQSTGIANLAEALSGEDGSGPDITDMLSSYSLAVYFSGTDGTNDDRYQFVGLNLRSTCDDNRGTDLNGPSLQEVSSAPFVDTMSGISLSYLVLSSSTLTNGALSLNFGDEAEFGGYVVW